MAEKPTYEEFEQRVKELEKEVVERKRVEEVHEKSDGPIIVNKLVTIIFGTLILFGFYLTTLYNYLLFHSIAELFIIVVACGIFIVAWNSRRFLDNNYLLFIGIAYLFIAVLELIHTLGYTGMGIFKGYGTNLPAQFWIAARYMESLSLLIAPLFFGRRIRLNIVFIAYASATCLILLSIFLWNIFPVCFVEGTGLTPFKKISEYIISLILIGSIALLFRKRKEFEVGVYRLLIASIMVTIAAELAFTFYIHAYGLSNLIGHYFTIISFYLIYKALIETGLVRPYDLLFRNLMQSKEVLVQKEMLLATTGRMAKVGGWEVNAETLEVWWTEETHRIHEVPLSYKPALDEAINFFHPEDRPKLELAIQRAIEHREPYDMEIRFTTAKGKHLWTHTICKPQIVDGKTVKLNGTFQDITERKRAEDALRESEERHRTLIETLSDMVFIVDANGSFTFINPEFEKITGFPAQDFIGHPFTEILAPEYIESTVDRFKRGLSGEKIPIYEVELKHKDGKTVPVELKVTSLLDADGEPIGRIGVARDISERKKMQEERLKARKLESLGALAGGIAHDFNNLLSVIMGNISLAQDDIKPEVGTSINLKEAEKASMRAKELTARLITFSRGGAPVKEVTSIGDMIKDSVSSTLSDSGIDCEISIPDDLSPVEIDEVQMKQVIYGITTNALEAMTGKGMIKVYCENVTVEEKDALTLRQGKYVRISTEDHGVGIPKDNLQKVFDPYFSTKEMGTEKGMGLGLSISHSIVKKHDGLITVESELGAGTTVHIYLPASEKEIAEFEPIKKAVPARPVTSRGKILVMDDEEMLRNVSAAMLRKMGCEVELAVDGAEAIEMYKKANESGKPFDAVILDLTNQFGMGGKEAIEKLREIDPDVKTIIASGYSNDPIMSNFGAYGFRGVLAKPFTMDELSKALHRVITGKDE